MRGKDTQARLKAMGRATSILSEHFDHVVILGTVDPPDSESPQPGMMWLGFGNWYAQKGMLDERLNHINQQALAREISDEMNPPDETESWKS